MIRILLTTLIILISASTSHAALRCFSQSGTYGNLVVTESGAGCGNDFTWNGFTAMWIGNGNANETCTFGLSLNNGNACDLDLSTLTVAQAALNSGEGFATLIDGSAANISGATINQGSPALPETSNQCQVGWINTPGTPTLF